MTCDIVNRQKEPKLVYKSDRGSLHNNLVEVLQNSDNFYEVGFKDAFGQLNVRGRFNSKGDINDFVRNEYLTPTPNGKYIATDEFAADIVEEHFILKSDFDSYRRDGLNFEFGDFSIKPEDFQDPNVREIFNTRNDIREAQNLLKNNMEKPKYNESELSILIKNTLSNLGFSVESVKNISGKLTANGMVDFSKKLVQVVDGNFESLTEEFSHIVVEAFDRTVVDNMLKVVHTTPEYAMYADMYRQIYSKQISDPDLLEKAVRKEVLGKMLAEALRNEFNISEKHSTSRNIFSKLIEMFQNFIKFVRSKLTSDVRSDIKDMASDVVKGLRQGDLEYRLHPMTDITVNVMYDARMIDPDRLKRYSRINFGIDHGEGVYREILDTLASVNYASEAALISLEEHDTDNGNVLGDVDLINTVERLRSVKSFVDGIYGNTLDGDSNNVSSTEVNRKKTFVKEVRQRVEEYNVQLGKIEAMYSRLFSDPSALVKDLETNVLHKNTNEEETQDRIDNKEYGVESIQRDTNMFWLHFGHIAKSSNLFVALGGAIVGKMHDEYLRNFDNGIQRFVKPLEVLKDELKHLVKNGRLRTGVDEDKVNKQRDAHKLFIINKMMSTDFQSVQEFEENGKEKFEEMMQVDVNKILFFLYDKKYASNKTWVKKESIDRDLKLFENLSEITGETDPIDMMTNNFVREIFQLSTNRNINHKLRKRKQSPYNLDGTLKPGFEIYTVKELKEERGDIPVEELVSDNPNVEVNLAKLPDETLLFRLNRDNGESDSVLAFDYMRWNRLLKQGSNMDLDNMFDNLEKAYEEQVEIADIKGLTGKDREEFLLDWFVKNVTFDNTQEYFDNIDTDIIDYDAILKSFLPKDVKNRVEKYRKELDELNTRKRNILKNFKDRLDYKEINITELNDSDKLNILKIESEARDVRKNLSAIFEQYEIPMEKPGSNAIVKLNRSTLRQIKVETGEDFLTGDIDLLSEYFLRENNSKLTLFEYNKEKAKIEGGISEYMDDYKRIARDLGLDPDDSKNLLRAFLLQRSMSWMKRYDSNEVYDKFLSDLDSGNVDVEVTMSRMFDNIKKGEKGLTYINKSGQRIMLRNMQFTPSFKFSGSFKPNKKLLIHKYQNTSDNKLKYDYIQKLNENDEVLDIYREDMSDIFNNPNLENAYFMSWDLQIERLKNDFVDQDTIDRFYISMLPQARRSKFERIHSVFRGKFNLASAKDWLLEDYAFREDDMEDSYKDNVIPMYGYIMLKDEERTEDYYHAMVWGLRNSYQRASRIKYIGHINKALRGIEAQTFEKNKLGKDTNYHKMLKQSIDFNFYGKTQSMKIEFTIPLDKWGMGQDIKLDFGKILLSLRGFSVKAALMFSPLTAGTNFFSGITQNLIMRLVGHDIYGKSNDRALSILGGNLHKSIGDIGEFDVKSRLNKIRYQFGYEDIEARYRDARYSKGLRILDEAGFGLMAATNYPLEMQVMLSKLTEYRLVNGEFEDWKTFKRRYKSKNPGAKESDIEREFDKLSKMSLYDFLDSEGRLDEEKMRKAGYTGNVEYTQDFVRASIRDVTERTTMEIRNINEAEGLRNPFLSFLTSMKKWMILATSAMFSRRRFNYDSMSEEEGLFFSLLGLPKHLKQVMQDRKNFDSVYAGLDDVTKTNLKKMWVTGLMMFSAYGLAMLLKGAADDDEEKDNYLLQLATIMAIRNLNELSSSQIGIGQAYFESIASPVMAASTVANVPKILNFTNIGEEVTRGKYKGMDKWVSDVYKATWIKNLYNVGLAPGGDYSAGEVVKQTRDSYLHFNTNESLYSILSLLPDKPSDKKKKDEERE